MERLICALVIGGVGETEHGRNRRILNMKKIKVIHGKLKTVSE